MDAPILARCMPSPLDVARDSGLVEPDGAATVAAAAVDGELLVTLPIRTGRKERCSCGPCERVTLEAAGEEVRVCLGVKRHASTQVFSSGAWVKELIEPLGCGCVRQRSLIELTFETTEDVEMASVKCWVTEIDILPLPDGKI